MYENHDKADLKIEAVGSMSDIASGRCNSLVAAYMLSCCYVGLYASLSS